MSDEFLDDLLGDGAGVSVAPSDETPEQRLFRELTAEGQYKKIYNCVYWFKHELAVYKTLEGEGMYLYRNFKDGKMAVNYKALGKALLKHYFLMTMHPRFHLERPEMQHKVVNLDKFLDMVIEYEELKKYWEDPGKLL